MHGRPQPRRTGIRATRTDSDPASGPGPDPPTSKTTHTTPPPATERRHPAVSLSVEDGNRARALYERAGFTVVGRNGGSDTMLLALT